jgi:folylpolyglutamate synthase/dihydropteroate synthase
MKRWILPSLKPAWAEGLDSTNVITPLLSVITNIGWDHEHFLGNTLPKIAAEKAGIIKSGNTCCYRRNT